jgi:TonB family protein
MENKKKTTFLHQPEYAGGPKELTRFIYEHLRYPEAALTAGVEGTVLVDYDIDYKGNVIDARVLRGIGHGCDEEACRVVRLLKFGVGKNRGVRVVFHKKAQIRFKIPVKAPASPPGPVQVQYNYVTTAAPAAPKEPAAEPAGQTYSYTVKLG